MIYKHLDKNHPLNQMADELSENHARYYSSYYTIDWVRIEKSWNSSKLVNNRVHTVNPNGDKITLTIKEFFDTFNSKIFGPFTLEHDKNWSRIGDKLIMPTFKTYFKMYRQGSVLG